MFIELILVLTIHQYVRVDEKMRHKNLKHLWLLLSEVWKLPPPKMIVSVTGGAKRFFMKNRIRKSFQRGLINVASSSGNNIM